MKNQIIKKSWILALAILAMGCKDDAPSPTNPEGDMEGRFLVAGVEGTATYFLSVPAEDLEDANTTLSIVNNGLEFNNTFSFYNPIGYDGLVALKYGQGNAHVGQRFTINAASGEPELVGAQFELQNGFVTAGVVENQVYSLMTGPRSSDPTLATLNRVPMSSGTPQFANFPVNEFEGYKGKNAQLLGIADAGEGSFFTGLSFWEDETLNDAVVAKINANTLQTEVVYTDERIGYSGGSMRSARYSQIDRVDNGDVYVFSGNNDGQKTAGVLVIRSGSGDFDQDYFWDIEAEAGHRFRKIFHLQGNKILAEFYNQKAVSGEETELGPDKICGHFAILDMADQELTWITGLPAKETLLPGGSALSQPYVFNDKLYMGVSNATETRFYIVDLETGAAAKGAVFGGVSNISGLTFVDNN